MKLLWTGTFSFAFYTVSSTLSHATVRIIFSSDTAHRIINPGTNALIHIVIFTWTFTLNI